MSAKFPDSPAAGVIFRLTEAIAYRKEAILKRRQPPRPDVRPGVSPSLLGEIQAAAFPTVIALAALAAEICYFGLRFDSPEHSSFYLGAAFLAAIVMSFISTLCGLNSVPHIVAGEAKITLILMAASTGFVLLVCLFNLLEISHSVPWGWFALWYVLSVAFLLAVRLGILLWARLLKAETRLLQRTAIYGHFGLASRVARHLQETDSNLVLTGVYSDDDALDPIEAPAGGMRELIGHTQSGACDRIILAMPSAAKERILDAKAQLELLPIDVQLCPDAMTVPSGLQPKEEGSSLVLIDLQRRPLDARGALVKTAMDYILGSIALVTSAPVMLAAAIAIKLDSRGPVFFIQSRHGYNHRIVRVIKFRTMTVAEDGPAVQQAVRGDRRVTRVGRFLRRTSIDELPQLFKGELSLVGPRPHAVAHNESYAQILNRYASRHKVKPGITGLAQVKGFRGETKTSDDMRQRVELDLYYIKNWSPLLDIQILARTILVPFFSSNAY
jgi:Undecaprenyl-phosphate glucose phosphotransferase